jgi:hypothetical protein
LKTSPTLWAGRKLDYLFIHHMEPDHAATIEDLVLRYPEAKIVCNEKIKTLLGQFFDHDMSSRIIIVKEGDTLSTGQPQLHLRHGAHGALARGHDELRPHRQDPVLGRRLRHLRRTQRPHVCR